MTIWNRPNTSLIEALGLADLPSPRVVAAIGSGGKTTLLHALAGECRALGWRTLLTTTTHMRRTPETNVSGSVATVLNILRQDSFCFAGIPAKQGKITGFSPDQLSQLVISCDCVLLEADGSKELPLKQHADHEPVLPPETSLLLRVAGLSALGGQVQSVCHRWTLCGLSGKTVVNPAVFAEILQRDHLISPPNVRCVTVFHQADTPELASCGLEIAHRLQLDDYLITAR